MTGNDEEKKLDSLKSSDWLKWTFLLTVCQTVSVSLYETVSCELYNFMFQ